MPDHTPPPPLEPFDDLALRLDALGCGLVSRERQDPPTSLLSAVRARRTLPMAMRIGLLAAAMVVIGFAVFFRTSRRPPAATQPQVVNGTNRGTPAPPSPPPHAGSSPTLATLRRLNPDPAPEALRLPTIATTTTLSIPTTPADSRDPGALARIVGPGR